MEQLINWDVFRRTAEHSTDGILVINKDGLIYYTNPTYERLVGVDREFAMKNFWGRTIFEMNTLEEVKQVLKTGKPLEHCRLVVEKAGIEVDFSITPVMDNESIAGAICIGALPQVVNLIDTLLQANDPYQREYVKFQPKSTLPDPFQKILGANVGFVKKLVKAAAAAQTDTNLLIQGESGTGKELLAHAVHKSSKRKDGPFVIVNCAAIPDSLLESELFGYEAGSFTGALKKGKQGKFEQANGGAIFLDEIGDLPLSIQAKLLRAIQFKQVEKIGGTKPIPTDVRIISATNKSLADEVKAMRFREDLYYRLSVIPIEMPPLRERKKEDLFLLMEQFLSFFSAQHRCNDIAYSLETLLIFYRYDWPGNIRELKNAVEHAFVMSIAEKSNRVLPRHLPGEVLKAVGWKHNEIENNGTGELKAVMKQVENMIVHKSYLDNGFNIQKTAEKLGISRAKLYDRLKEMGLSRKNAAG